MGASSEVPRNAGTTLNHRQNYATVEEIEWLQGIAGAVDQAVILGAGPGIMAASLKDGNPKVRILLVDNDTCHWATMHLADFGPEYLDNVEGLEMDSAEAGKKYVGLPIDLLIIDADHSERAVGADFRAWIDHVKIGGYIFFHDYDATGTVFENQEQYPGVKNAVARYMKSHIFLNRVGTAVIYQKAGSE